MFAFCRVWLDRIRHPLEDVKIKADVKDMGPNGLKSSADIMHDIKVEWLVYFLF